MAETAVVEATAEEIIEEAAPAGADEDIVEGAAGGFEDGAVRVGEAALDYFDWCEERSAVRRKRGLEPEELSREARVAVTQFVSYVTPSVEIGELTPHQMTAYQEVVGSNATDVLERLQPVKDFLRFCWKERSLTDTNLGNNIRIRRKQPDQEQLKKLKGELQDLQKEMPRAELALAQAHEVKDTSGIKAARERVERLKGKIDDLKKEIDKKERQIGQAKAVHEAGVRFDVTEEGLKKMNADLVQLQAEMPRAVQAVAQAREDKDIRENAPLEAAREYQERLKGRIDELEYQIAHAVVTEGVATGRAHVGSTVKVALLDRETERIEEYTLVGPTEVDAAARRISIESPMGRGLFDKSAGSQVVIEAPRGTIRFRVVAVEG